MKKMLLLAAALTLLTLSGCAAKQENKAPEHVFRFAENQAGNFPTTMGAQYFADRVLELSEGRIRIHVFPDEALGDERSIIEQMQFGGIDFSRVNLSPLSEYDERLFVLQLPYLYRDNAHKWRVLESEIGDYYLESLGELGLVGLSWVDAGARNFYTIGRPVQTLEDMQGLRIRVQENTLMERLVELLGAEPIQMRYGEVLSALQTGKIDGAENNYPSYQSTGHYLVATYVLEDEHSRIPEVMIASAKTMERLSEADREIIRVAAQEAVLYQRTLWLAYEQETKQQVLESGCAVYTMTEAEKAAFQEATAIMYEEFAGDSMDVVEAILAM